MIKTKGISIGKFDRNSINEDAVIARRNVIAVSDGAGGGGLFADRWSKYLLKNLPDKPILSAEELDEWIASIWEPYYERAEDAAKSIGGLALDKFYDEGSFATLAAIWKLPDGTCRWMTYGDSVVFRYDYVTEELLHSFSSLEDFNNPPYLINCKDELNLSGFKSGIFNFNKNCIVFVASDALAHYILMMYELSHRDVYAAEIHKALLVNSKNSNILMRGCSLSPFKFEKDVIGKLRKGGFDRTLCKKWLTGLYERGLIAFDDYSFAMMME